jgi:hypothetical protein
MYPDRSLQIILGRKFTDLPIYRSTEALNAILTLDLAALLSSYTICIGCLALKRIRGEPLPPRQRTLGKWGSYHPSSTLQTDRTDAQGRPCNQHCSHLLAHSHLYLHPIPQHDSTYRRGNESGMPALRLHATVCDIFLCPCGSEGVRVTQG